nr:ribonuclease H-like domain-containing protein [Tanacetum cinerariifolium]
MPLCFCSPQTIIHTSWTDNHPRRRFHSCPRLGETSCDFFDCTNEPVSANTSVSAVSAKLPVSALLNVDTLSNAMRIEKYFLMTDYSLWEVILNGDSLAPTRVIEGVVQPVSQLLLNRDLEEQSLDDLFNNLKIYEAEVKSYSSASTSTQNIPFVSSSNTDNTNELVSAATSVSAVSAKLPVYALLNVDTLSNAVECYNCHKKGYFARECRSPKDTRRIGAAEPQRRNVPLETSTSNALVSQCDGVGSYDWSFQAEEEHTNYAFMAFTSSSSSSDNEDAKTLMEAIEKRFGGNKETKKRTERNLEANRPTFMGFDMSKVECYNCHMKGHFARKYRSPKDTRRNGTTKPQKRNVPVETSTSNAWVSQCDGVGNYDWSFQEEEEPANYALMAFTSSSSSSDHEVVSCSKACTKAYATLQYQSGDGYHVVPPPYTGMCMPPKPDLVFHNAPTDTETVYTTFNVELSPIKPNNDWSHTYRPSAPIIKDWVFDSNDDSETKIPHDVPSFVQSNEQVKSPMPFVKTIETSILTANTRTAIPKPKRNGNYRNKKACFTKEQMEEEDSRALKRISESQEDKAAKKQKLDEEVAKLNRHLQIVPNDEDDVYTKATPLARKVTVVDYEIYTKNNKPYFKIIRVDGTHQLFLSFLSLLRNFDREDLEVLCELVKESFGVDAAKDFKEKYANQDKTVDSCYWNKVLLLVQDEEILLTCFPTTVEQRLARKNMLKARGTLLMALPDKHQLKFNIHKDAKTLMEAIEKRTHTLIWRNKIDLEEQSLDDLFNSLKIYEAEVKSSSSASTSTQNIPFVSSSNTDNTNEPVSAATSVFAVSAKLPIFALLNVDTLSNAEMDLKWQMAMLTVRARQFLQRTEWNLRENGPTFMGFDMSKVECYNCHKKGHFARECRSPKDTRRIGAAEPQMRNVPVETSTSNALVSQSCFPTTVEQRLARKNELKAHGTLLMALPDKHQLKVNIHKDAKTLMEAIEKRFGGNKETKKVQKTLLKQQHENFTDSSSKSLEQIHDRLTHTLIWRNKTDLEEQSLDDLFNSLNEAEVKSSFCASTSTQNIAFVSSFNTDITNEPVSDATSVFAISAKLLISALLNIDADDLEEMDLKWKGHFAKKYRSPKDTRRNGTTEPQKRNVPVETSTSNAWVSQCDGVGNYDWSFQAEEEPTNYALMAFTSSSSSSNNELRDNALVVLRQNLKKAEQERDDLKLKLEKFQTSSKNLSQLLASQTNDKTTLGYNTQVFTRSMFDYDDYFTSESDECLPPSPIYDRYHSRDGYHVVPPPYAGTFMPPKPDLVFHNAPNINETIHNAFNVELSPTKPVNDLSHTHRPSAPIIEDWVSDSDDKSETKISQNVPSFVQPTRQGNPQHDLKDKGVIDSRCSRYMTGNMSYMSDFEEQNGGYVAFGGNPKGGKISGKGKTRTGKLDFDDVYFVKKIKFNLFSVSQMCDKKNRVFFTNTECLVLSLEFKLPDENQVLLRVHRKNNMYNVNLKNIVPYGDLTCLFAKATSDESNLWHRRLSHINFK